MSKRLVWLIEQSNTPFKQVAKKKVDKKLYESRGMKLSEEKGFDEEIILEAPLASFDDPNSLNENDRWYSKKPYLEEIERLQEEIKKRALFGSPDHPEEGYQVSMKEISHMITKLWYNEEDNRVWVQIKLIPTIIGGGCDLIAIHKAGGQLRGSARAIGYYDEDTKEATIDTIFTVDVVSTPGFAFCEFDKPVNANDNQHMYPMSESDQTKIRKRLSKMKKSIKLNESVKVKADVYSSREFSKNKEEIEKFEKSFNFSVDLANKVESYFKETIGIEPKETRIEYGNGHVSIISQFKNDQSYKQKLAELTESDFDGLNDPNGEFGLRYVSNGFQLNNEYNKDAVYKTIDLEFNIDSNSINVGKVLMKVYESKNKEMEAKRKLNESSNASLEDYFHRLSGTEQEQDFYDIISNYYEPEDDGESESEMLKNLSKHEDYDRILQDLINMFGELNESKNKTVKTKRKLNESTTEISKEDVESVAKNLGIKLKDGSIEKVLEVYDDYVEDPENEDENFSVIVELIIHDLNLSEGKKRKLKLNERFKLSKIKKKMKLNEAKNKFKKRRLNEALEEGKSGQVTTTHPQDGDVEIHYVVEGGKPMIKSAGVVGDVQLGLADLDDIGVTAEYQELLDQALADKMNESFDSSKLKENGVYFVSKDSNGDEIQAFMEYKGKKEDLHVFDNSGDKIELTDEEVKEFVSEDISESKDADCKKQWDEQMKPEDKIEFLKSSGFDQFNSELAWDGLKQNIKDEFIKTYCSDLSESDENESDIDSAECEVSVIHPEDGEVNVLFNMDGDEVEIVAIVDPEDEENVVTEDELEKQEELETYEDLVNEELNKDSEDGDLSESKKKIKRKVRIFEAKKLRRSNKKKLNESVILFENSGTKIQLFKDGKEITASDGIMFTDGRYNIATVEEKIKDRNKRFGKNFPNKVADSYAIYNKDGRSYGEIRKLNESFNKNDVWAIVLREDTNGKHSSRGMENYSAEIEEILDSNFDNHEDLTDAVILTFNLSESRKKRLNESLPYEYKVEDYLTVILNAYDTGIPNYNIDYEELFRKIGVNSSQDTNDVVNEALSKRVDSYVLKNFVKKYNLMDEEDLRMYESSNKNLNESKRLRKKNLSESKDLVKSLSRKWKEMYGETFSKEYPAFWKNINDKSKYSGEITLDTIINEWNESYGEDFVSNYLGVWKTISGENNSQIAERIGWDESDVEEELNENKNLNEDIDLSNTELLTSTAKALVSGQSKEEFLASTEDSELAGKYWDSIVSNANPKKTESVSEEEFTQLNEKFNNLNRKFDKLNESMKVLSSLSESVKAISTATKRNTILMESVSSKTAEIDKTINSSTNKIKIYESKKVQEYRSKKPYLAKLSESQVIEVMKLDQDEVEKVENFLGVDKEKEMDIDDLCTLASYVSDDFSSILLIDKE